MENLRILREKQNKNQVNLAVNIGAAQEMISSYESGRTFPTAKNLIKLAKYLNTSTDYLLELTNDPTPYKTLKSDLTDKEKEILSNYNSLSNQNKLKLEGYLDALKWLLFFSYNSISLGNTISLKETKIK